MAEGSNIRLGIDPEMAFPLRARKLMPGKTFAPKRHASASGMQSQAA